MKRFRILGFLASLIICTNFACSSGESSKESSSVSSAATIGAGQSGVVDNTSNPNVVQVAVGSPDHGTLVAALKAAEYVDALTNVGPFTVFAPTDAAFGKLPAGTVENLVKPENQRALRDILEYHVLLGVYNTESFVDGQSIGTADGRNIKMAKAADGTITVNGAKILGSVKASNGIIHVIDAVLIPE
jgi:uncharacterized surface protein with fasciclin (FAS1) repeats